MNSDAISHPAITIPQMVHLCSRMHKCHSGRYHKPSDDKALILPRLT